MDERAPGGMVSQTSTMPLAPELRERLEAVRVEEAKRQSLAERVKRERRILLPMLGLSVLALPNFRFARVEGRSMEPTLHTGDTLVLLKTYRTFAPLKVGDIIVIRLKHGKNAGEEIVKRVVFLQNQQGTIPWPDTLMTGRGEVSSQFWFPQYGSGGASVPPGGIIVMGDNVMNSMDSRDFGPVLDYEIEGKVINS